MADISKISAKEGFSYFSVDKIELDKANIYTIEDLKKFIKNHPKYNWDNELKRIREIEALAEKRELAGTKTTVYSYDSILPEDLKYVDGKVKGVDLLYNNPMNVSCFTKYSNINYMTIEEIKRSIELQNKFGNSKITDVRGIGKKAVDNIIKSLRLYEEQVIYQAFLTSNRTRNLFKRNYDDKTEIIDDMYSDIVEYITEYGYTEAVWGSLSDKQKELYVETVLGTSRIDKQRKEQLINVIANYSTLPELEYYNDNKDVILGRIFK